MAGAVSWQCLSKPDRRPDSNPTAAVKSAPSHAILEIPDGPRSSEEGHQSPHDTLPVRVLERFDMIKKPVRLGSVRVRIGKRRRVGEQVVLLRKPSYIWGSLNDSDFTMVYGLFDTDKTTTDDHDRPMKQRAG